MNSDGQHETLTRDNQHYEDGWYKPLDDDTSDKLRSFSDRQYGAQTKERAAMNMSCRGASLPLIPAHFVVFDTQVRNTFLHIPLPSEEHLEQPEQRRAWSAPPRRSPIGGGDGIG